MQRQIKTKYILGLWVFKGGSTSENKPGRGSRKRRQRANRDTPECALRQYRDLEHSRRNDDDVDAARNATTAETAICWRHLLAVALLVVGDWIVFVGDSP